jgi:hypothetical protein
MSADSCRIDGLPFILRIGLCTVAAAVVAMPGTADAQRATFVALGGGLTMPSGRASDAMRNGWIAEVMAGVTIFDGVIGLRLGANYGESTSDPLLGGMDMDAMASGLGPPPQSGRTKRLGLMVGGMLMPLEIGRVTPYVLADAGTLRSTFVGHQNSFMWQAGGGVMLDLTRTRLYIETRYMEARKGSDSGAMLPITVGLRFPR